MIEDSRYEFCEEFYVVEKAVELAVEIGGYSKHLRIEALHHPASGQFSTSAYVREYVTAQPTYPQSNGNFDRKAEDMAIWVTYDLPWTMGESADEVIGRALSFVRERADKSSVGV